MDFEKWYKSTVESQPETPPGEVWDAIQNDLDVDAVWARLDAGLTTAKVRPLYHRLALAASVLLLVAAGSWYFLSGNLTQTNQVTGDAGEEEPSEVTPPPPPDLPTANPTAHAGALATQGIEESTPITSPTSHAMALTMPDIEESAPTFKETPDKGPAFIRMPARPGAIDRDRMVAGINTRYTRSEATRPSDGKKVFSEFTIGLSGHFANTWLLNTKTIEGLKRSDLTDTGVSFGQNLGFRAGTNLGEKSALRLEWYFLSQSRQRYNEYVNGKYVSTSLNLDYHNLALVWQYQPGVHGSPHQIAAGLYAGSLRRANKQLDVTLVNVSAEYAKLDYGFILGYEYVFPLKPGLSFGTGVYAKYGLNNVFSGNESVPAYLNHTQNAALMLSFSLNHIIR